MKTILTIGLVSFHLIMVSLCHYTGKNFYNQQTDQNTNKIYDLGVAITPDLSKVKSLSLIMDLLTFVPPIMFGLDIFETFAEYSIVISILRYFIINLTILPKEEHCDDSQLTWSNYITGHCYDKIFSGHFASTFLLSIILYQKGIVTNLLPLVIFNSFNAWLIIATRSHYTIDLVVSILVTTLLILLRSHF
jgi:hypothetical protein